MILDYYILNPTGNITALVVNNSKTEDSRKYTSDDYKKINDAIMKKHPNVEQVGFVDFSSQKPFLRMAGGEFCGNATMCTAVLYCLINNIGDTKIPVEVFGTDGEFEVSVSKTGDTYRSSVEIPKPDNCTEMRRYSFDNKEYIFPTVNLSGITHVIVGNDFESSSVGPFLKKYTEELSVPAMGVMMLNNNSLTPVIYVKSCNTLFFENSCASGCCAVGIYLSESKKDNLKVELSQPGGSLTVEVPKDKNFVKLYGSIKPEGYYSCDL